MRIILLLSAVCAVSANNEVKCDGKEGIEVRGQFHKSEELKNGLNRPYQLIYDKERHQIFFSNNVGNDTEDYFEIIRLELKNKTIEKVEGIVNGFATALNEEKGIAYFGGSDGVHEYNLKEGSLTKIIDKHDIWDMFFKKHLYFITYPQQRLYKYPVYSSKSKNHDLKPIHEEWIHEKIYQFAIDGQGDIFFTNSTGLYMVKNGSEHRHQIHGETMFRCIALNNEGEAHFCGQNAIYIVNKDSNTLFEIAHVSHIFGLTFDEMGLMIYSNPLAIVKLIPSKCLLVDNVIKYIPLVTPLPVPDLHKSGKGT